jgi:hypothetical protein
MLSFQPYGLHGWIGAIVFKNVLTPLPEYIWETDASFSSQPSQPIYLLTTRHHNPEERNLHGHRRENLRTHTVTILVLLFQ